MKKFILIQIIILNVLSSQSSTWETIQDSIWTPNCVMCHDHELYFAEQSGLILAEDVAYEELINAVPTNQAAADAGLELVGDDGIASVYTSFLWEKINANDYEHFYGEHSDFGNMMPLGMDFLTNGELEFIRQWIIAGAPELGIVADISILDDTSIFEIPEFGPLPLPENGIQFHVGPFDVPPQFEREFFYFTEVDTPDFLYVNRIETAMSPGSHHFVVYTFDENLPLSLPTPNVYRDIRNVDGSYNNSALAYMSYNKFITGTQTRFFDYRLPEGVALELDPSYGFDLNPHYTNYSNDTIQGEIYNNYHFVDPSEVDFVAKVLQLNGGNIALPPGVETTINDINWISSTISIFQLWSHAHQHNLDFKVYLVNQSDPNYRELIYMALDWHHPPIVDYDPPIVLHVGDGIELEATYYNFTNETIYEGLLSTDEMMILFGLYYEGENMETDIEIVSIPNNISINKIYPNPFNPTTTIQFSVETSNETSLHIFDITGKMVETMVNDEIATGEHKVVWNATRQPSGVYFARLSQGDNVSVQKMILLK